MMTPAEWHRAWPPGHLMRPIDRPDLPPGARAFARDYGLPSVLIFEIEGASACRPFEWRFHPLEKELVPFTKLLRRAEWGDDDDARLNELWSDQLMIADEEFCNGNAAICVHSSLEHISRLDWEIEDAGNFVNTSIAQFAESMLTLVGWCEKHGRGSFSDRKANVQQLLGALGQIDANAITGARSLPPMWPILIEGVITYEGTDRCDITSDPTRSKSRF